MTCWSRWLIVWLRLLPLFLSLVCSPPVAGPTPHPPPSPARSLIKCPLALKREPRTRRRRHRCTPPSSSSPTAAALFLCLHSPAADQTSALCRESIKGCQGPPFFSIGRIAPAKAAVLVALKWKTCCANLGSKLDAAAGMHTHYFHCLLFFGAGRGQPACYLASPSSSSSSSSLPPPCLPHIIPPICALF